MQQLPPSSPLPVVRQDARVGVSAGTAFKIGFFGLLGAWVAAILPAVILLVLFSACGLFAAFGHPSTTTTP